MRILKIEIEINLDSDRVDMEYLKSEEDLTMIKEGFMEISGILSNEITRFELIEKDENPNRTDNSIG